MADKDIDHLQSQPPALGLGLRRDLINEWKRFEALDVKDWSRPHFIEIAPENWLELGGRFKKDLNFFSERYPVFAHGLSLSLGSPSGLDWDFISRLKQFFEEHQVIQYSEHLSYCSDDGHLYDLAPIPFTEEAVKHVSSRIRQVQEELERRIAVENISYYAAPGQRMSEYDFLCAVLDEADCDLLLDINNVWVNSNNHGYDAEAFIRGLPADRIAYFHIAGHLDLNDVIIDTHGADICDPVWDLLFFATQHVGMKPTVLERDTNIPPLPELLNELAHARVTMERAVETRRMHHQPQNQGL